MYHEERLELDALIAKYGRLDGVAYAYIQDPKGEIIASSLQPFPAELKNLALIRQISVHLKHAQPACAASQFTRRGSPS
jgi:hypothetical protein